MRRQEGRARVFRAARRCGAAGEHAATWARLVFGGLFDGVALATSSPAQLRAIDERLYAHDDLYADVAYNTGGFQWWERDAVDRLFPTSGRVFVWAAGGGREMVEFARRGFAVEGCEYNSALAAGVDVAFDHAGTRHGRMHACERDMWPPTATGPYQALVLGWSSYSLVRGRGTRVELLERAASVLDPGAPMLLSYFAATDAHRYIRSVALGGRLTARWFGVSAPERGDMLTPNFAHMFEEQGLRAEVEAAGFEIVEISTVGVARAVCRRVVMSDDRSDGCL